MHWQHTIAGKRISGSRTPLFLIVARMEIQSDSGPAVRRPRSAPMRMAKLKKPGGLVSLAVTRSFLSGDRPTYCLRIEVIGSGLEGLGLGEVQCEETAGAPADDEACELDNGICEERPGDPES